VALLIGRTEIPWDSYLLLAVAVPVANTAYFLFAEELTRDVKTMTASCLVLSGAAGFWTVTALARGEAALPHSPEAWAIVAGFVVVPSLLGVPLMLGAIARIGSARTALLSTVEPIVTVVLAVALLGESLGASQIVGAGLILGTAAVLQSTDRPIRAPFDKTKPDAPKGDG
jgi:drug/metabolite transporter (DMT)-like permease